MGGLDSIVGASNADDTIVFALEIGFEAGEQADMKVNRATEVSAGLTISTIKESHLRSCDGFAR